MSIAPVSAAVSRAVIYAAFALCATSLRNRKFRAFLTVSNHQGLSRVQRLGRRAEVTLDHLLASSAIPMVVSADALGDEYSATAPCAS